MGFRGVHPRREITQARLTLNLMLLHFALAGSPPDGDLYAAHLVITCGHPLVPFFIQGDAICADMYPYLFVGAIARCNLVAFQAKLLIDLN